MNTLIGAMGTNFARWFDTRQVALGVAFPDPIKWFTCDNVEMPWLGVH
jgi:hypothetical protein